MPQHPALRYYLPSVLNEDLQSVRSSLVDAKNSFFGKTRKSERALGALAAHRTAVPMPQNGAELLAVVDELEHPGGEQHITVIAAEAEDSDPGRQEHVGDPEGA